MSRPANIFAASAAIVAGLFGLASAASAQAPGQSAPKVVLELYTSQGCSSCPPADILLKSYIARPDVIALSLPVDYWDYIGWKDTFASPKYSARQRAYSKQRGDGKVYTPQMVVNGIVHTIGSSRSEIDQAIRESEAQVARNRVAVTIREEGGQLLIEAGQAPDGGTFKEANIWLAMVQRDAEVQVRSGENRGSTLRYHNVVRELTAIGMWSGKPMTVRLNRDTIAQPGADGVAVLLQNGKAGPIIGAAMLGKI